LRTPLNAILGYSRLLQSGMLTADKRTHALQTVERNATSLTKIVEDILDVSRIISGKIRLNIQSVDFPDVVSNAVETVMPAAEAKQIRVQTMLDPRAAPISGDPDRLQQIVWNCPLRGQRTAASPPFVIVSAGVVMLTGGDLMVQEPLCTHRRHERTTTRPEPCASSVR
jgi:light-regulated signal transduction histidine kinase (bacteriophytochrome)